MNFGEFNQTIYQFNKQYQSLLSAIADKHALTSVEVEILLFLSNNPGYNRAIDIVSYRKIAKSFVSKALELLQAKKLIILTQDPKDKRSNLISLTEKALPITKDAKTGQNEFYADIFKNLSYDDEINLKRIMQLINLNLKEYKHGQNK